MLIHNPRPITSTDALLPDIQISYYNETLQPNLWAASTTCFGAACVAAGLRLYSRRLKCQRLAWDDYMMLVAVGFYVPFYIAITVSISWGAGHIDLMPPPEYLQYVRLNTIVFLTSSVLSTFPLYFAKVGDAVRPALDNLRVTNMK